MFFHLGKRLKTLLGINNGTYQGLISTKNAKRRIIVGIRPRVHKLLIQNSTEIGPAVQLTAEHLIRLGIATEQKLAALKLLEPTPLDLRPERAHEMQRKYIAINRRLYFLVKRYAIRHRMTAKGAAEHLICLGLVAKKGLEYLSDDSGD